MTPHSKQNPGDHDPYAAQAMEEFLGLRSASDHDDLDEAQRLLDAMMAQRRAAGIHIDPGVAVAQLLAEMAQLRAEVARLQESIKARGDGGG